VPQTNAGLQDRQLERERAAQHEGDEIVGPVFADVGGLIDELAVLEHAITRHVGADVDVAQIRQRGIARRAHADQRTRLGVALAECGELQRQLLGQDAQVALDVVGRDARRVSRIFPRSDDAPGLARAFDPHQAVGGRARRDLLHWGARWPEC
jgi:hypothetical protein